MVNGLCQSKLLLQCPGIGKADAQYIPILRAKVPLADLIQHREVSSLPALPETYNIDAFMDYMHKFRFRQENAQLLSEVLQESSSRKNETPAELP
jgi:hypothetical protein